MKVRYTKPALRSLEALLTFIHKESPQGAMHVQNRLYSLVTLIAGFPKIGQTTTRSGIRRLVAAPYPYIILYRVKDDEIIIHGFRHAHRKPPTSAATSP